MVDFGRQTRFGKFHKDVAAASRFALFRAVRTIVEDECHLQNFLRFGAAVKVVDVADIQHPIRAIFGHFVFGVAATPSCGGIFPVAAARAFDGYQASVSIASGGASHAFVTLGRIENHFYRTRITFLDDGWFGGNLRIQRNYCSKHKCRDGKKFFHGKKRFLVSIKSQDMSRKNCAIQLRMISKNVFDNHSFPIVVAVSKHFIDFQLYELYKLYTLSTFNF